MSQAGGPPQKEALRRASVGSNSIRAFALISITVAFFSAAFLYLNRPITLRIAAGPTDGQLVGYVRSISRELLDSRYGFRVSIIQTNGSEESGALLEQGKADLAVLRSDDENSSSARAVVVIHRKMLLFVTRSQPDRNLLKTIGEKNGGLLQSFDPTFIRALRQLYEHYGLAHKIPSVEIVSAVDAVKSLKDGALDYLVAIVHPSDKTFHNMMLQLNSGDGPRFEIGGPPAAAGAATQLLAFENSDVIEGLIGGSPPLPEKQFATLSLTYELVAPSNTSERRIALLTKTILDLSATLRGAHDGALRIESPTLEQPRRFLPHAGTSKQLAGEAETFLEEYSDVIWMAIFGFSFLGSAFSGIFAFARSRRRRTIA